MIQKFLIFSLCLLLASCGGGSSTERDTSDPSEFEQSAKVKVKVKPANLDTGERMNASILLKEVHPQGIYLKIRTPLGLEYIKDSGFLVIDNLVYDLSPDFLLADSSHNYLVYIFKQKDFGKNIEGEIKVAYYARSAVSKGEFEVDVDLDDGDGFEIEKPKFSPIAKVEIKIE